MQYGVVRMFILYRCSSLVSGGCVYVFIYFLIFLLHTTVEIIIREKGYHNSLLISPNICQKWYR